MIEVNETELTFSFPEGDKEAILRIHFCPSGSRKERARIQGSPGGGFRLAMEGRFVMYLLPELAQRDRLYRAARYPFALLVSVGGKNAITGEVSTTLSRSPQNYFTTPPQGGIDGHFVRGRVHPFRAAGEATASETC